MSGAEAGFIIGLISSVISIIEGAKTVYDAAGDAKGQPEAFRQVAARLPLVIQILRRAEAVVRKLDEMKQEAIELILKDCKAKAEQLQELFQKVIRKDSDNWFARYKKALHTLVKGDKVECLMKGILKGIKLLAYEKLVGIADDAQIKELEEGINEMEKMPSSLQEDTGNVTQTHSGGGDNIGHSGSGNIYAGDAHHNQNGNVTYNYSNLSDSSAQCLRDLRTTDPREDKKRIEETKGGLLKDSYIWVLENSEFKRWQEDEQSRLLWIRGDPGKGKTMLLCGIMDKFKEIVGAASARSHVLSYFFCQATDSRINSATAVLRGLIFLLADQQMAVRKHIQRRYDNAGKELFIDTNSWYALSEIFTNILQDPSLERTYVVIDALDECVTGLQGLLRFINNTLPITPRVKWLISSRNWPSIKENLRISDQEVQLRLELNQDSVSAAVRTYIKHRVGELAKFKRYNDNLKKSVWQYVSDHANGTFLWVALVIQELDKVDRRHALERLRAFPSGLGPLYKQMLDQVCNSGNANLCKRILSIMAVVQRPITLRELVSLDDELHDSDYPEDISKDIEDVEQTTGECGSFLTIRESTIYFVHQSAKDFLLRQDMSQELFPSGKDETNHAIFSKSLQIMSAVLRRDVYNLRAPGISVEQIKQPDPDPLAAVRYSCLHWVDHLLGCQSREETIKDFEDGGKILIFLCQYFLYWLEALSLIGRMSESITMINKLIVVSSPRDSAKLSAFLHDARRFILTFHAITSSSPLQLYSSAIIFAPETSLIRNAFLRKDMPDWISQRPKVEMSWNAVLQTLEGHSSRVFSVAFSHDSKVVASASLDNTVRLWDAATGSLQHTLEGHSSRVFSVAFSHNSKVVASASWDKTVRLWDVATGSLQQTLIGHSDDVNSVAFSHNSKMVASASDDKTVRLWDAATGSLQQTLEGHSSRIYSVVFSHDSKLLVSASWDKIVRLWDAATGSLLQKIVVDKYVSTLSFDKTNSTLITNIGCFDLDNIETSPSLTSHAKIDIGDNRLELADDSPWIKWNGENLLWLPPDFRGISSMTGPTFAIGTPSGKVFIIGISLTYLRSYDCS